MKDFKPLGKPWLEHFHINKYVKSYDARVENRYLNPPEFQRLEVGDRVFVSPRGRYKMWVRYDHVGKYGFVKSIREDEIHKYHGRVAEVELILTGEKINYREVAFRRPKPLTSEKDMSTNNQEV